MAKPNGKPATSQAASNETVKVEEVQAQVATVPAASFVALTPANSGRMNSYMSSLLKQDEPMQQLQLFVMATGLLTPALTDQITKSTLPQIQVDDLDNNIKALDEAVVAVNKQADEACADIDKQISALNELRNQARKPFADKVEEALKAKGELATQRETRLTPLREAITALHNSLTESSNELLKSVIADDEKRKVKVPELLDVLVTINAPTSHGTSSVTSTSTSSGGGGRGRGSQQAVTISKGAETHSFNSMNAARNFVYKQVEGKEPDYQANATACEKYLTKHGWTLK